MRNLRIGLLAAAAIAVVALPQGTRSARADDFELAMVIKETTNPYYNATLKGAQIAAKETGGTPKGKIAIVSAQPTAANQNLWIESFKDEMKKYPDVEIVDTVYGYDNEQKAFDATVALTTKYPDLAGIFAPTCPGLPAVARALESVDKGNGKIKVSGNCVPSITA